MEITTQQKKDIAKFTKKGDSQRAIAAKVGCSRSTVFYHQQKNKK